MKYFALRVLFCLFALTVPLAQEAWGQEIIPLLRCVRLQPEPNTLDVFFGYYSSYPTTVHIDFDNNLFYPGEENRNQPTDFLPGMHENVFVASYQAAIFQPELTWVILGRSVTAKSDVRLSCDPPVGRQAWNPTTTYGFNEVVSHNGFLWISPLRVNFSPFLNINHEPDLPLNAGWWSLYAPKGVPGELGPKGDKGDRGDSGLSVLAQVEPAGNNCAYGGAKLTDSGGIRFVCNGAPGKEGPQGIQGLTGPGGPGTSTNASQAYTLPRGGMLTITDSRVTPNSMITVQYVGDSFGCSPAVVAQVQQGRFTVRGIANKQFRYVVFN